MESFFPHDPWGWCYVDEVMLDFTGNQTPLTPRRGSR
jgi:hypothetical protein